MFSKISVLVPTRHRVPRLKTLLASFTAVSAELVFRVDEDDRDTLDFLLDVGRLRILVGPRLQGYRSMSTYFNDMVLASSGDVLMLGNDDMVFKTAAWDSFVLDAANQFSDGVFNLGVHTFNEDHYPFSIVSRKAVEQIGFLWDPRLVWGDLFLRDVMGAFGRSMLLPTVEVEHDWVGHNPDVVFLEGGQSNPENWNPAYWEKHRACVAEAVDKLRAA